MAEAKKMRNEASTSGFGAGGDGSTAESVVLETGRRKSTCGYCKSGGRTSISHGLWAHSLTVDAYQALVDRGWRRSGCFLYKPDMEKTCCPSYTIRLKAADFAPSKEQIRVYKKIERFLEGNLDVQRTCISKDEATTSGGFCSPGRHCDKIHGTKETLLCGSKPTDKADQLMHLLSDQINSTIQVFSKIFVSSWDIQLPKASVKKVVPAKRKLKAQESEELIFSSGVAFQIVATLRRLNNNVEGGEAAELNLVHKQDSSEFTPQKIAEYLAGHSKELAESHGLFVRACNGHINYYSKWNFLEVEVGSGTRKSETYPLVHVGNDKHLEKAREGHLKQRRSLEIRLEKSCFDYEEYSLYKKYQLIVHNDTPDHVTESSYKRFLVDTPLIHAPPNGDRAAPSCGFGSFHQQYLVDGKLLAVGVIDILPNFLSSKYLFWDPELASLSLGKYSALEEIKWVNENQVSCPSLQYYYLGYYIHSCRKMKYKAGYQPSELLCPLHYEWIPFSIAKPLLDRNKYVVLSDYANLHDVEVGLSPPNITDGVAEEKGDGIAEEAVDDVVVNDDEMTEVDSELSDDDDETEAETSSGPAGDVDLSHVLIGVRGLRFRYKDIKHAFDPPQRGFMENQLKKYVQAVGLELAKEMVYSMG